MALPPERANGPRDRSRRVHILGVGLIGACLALGACSAGSATSAASHSDAQITASSPTAPTVQATTATASASPSLTTHPPSVSPSPSHSTTASASRTHTAATAPSTAPVTIRPGHGVLSGKVIVIDPGHNGGNGSHPSIINQPVWILTGWLTCDTTGTQTDSGYLESSFNLDVADRAAAILRGLGATVILTRYTNTGVGPCINVRAAIGNRAHADAAISIHADGGPAGGVGFQIIRPGDIGANHAIIARSDVLAAAMHAAFHSVTNEPFATYVGGGTGYTTRTNLGGLNLSTVPKVFIECANMRGAADAARVTSPAWRQLAARGIAAGLEAYLLGR